MPDICYKALHAMFFFIPYYKNEIPITLLLVKYGINMASFFSVPSIYSPVRSEMIYSWTDYL